MTDVATIRAKLTAEEWAVIDGTIRGAERRGYEAGYNANGWLSFFRGLRRSWTAGFAALIAAWPVLEPQLKALLVPRVVPDDAWSYVVSLVGAVVLIAIRANTRESLESKGTK